MARFILLLAVMLIAACNTDQARIQKLIDRVNATDVPWEDPEAIDALAQYGVKASPALIAEFERAHEAAFMNFTEVLARIPSPERNAAFQKVLDHHDSRGNERFFNQSAARMMDALAADQCAAAVPTIRKFAVSPRTGYLPRDFDGDRNELRAHAVAALNALGRPLPPRLDSEFMTVDTTATKQLEEPAVAAALPAIKATLDQVFQNASSTSTLTVAGINASTQFQKVDSMMPVPIMSERARTLFANINAAGSGIFELGGSFTAHQGHWSITTALLDENNALVFAMFSRGPLWARGYTGRLVQRDGRWLVVEWQMTWLS